MQVFTSDHALKLEWVPDWIAIIGSGYIGLEFSDVYTALGSEVTFIEVGLSTADWQPEGCVDDPSLDSLLDFPAPLLLYTWQLPPACGGCCPVYPWCGWSRPALPLHLSEAPRHVHSCELQVNHHWNWGCPYTQTLTLMTKP